MLKNFIISAALILFLAGCAQKSADITVSESAVSLTETGSPKAQDRWTFSRDFTGSDVMKPRGGTTKGAPVVIDTTPNQAYQSISAPGISKYERDRRAILAMAGIYQVSFDFVETVALTEGYELDRPYQSWATEIVEVLEDNGDFISLQHILVMYFVTQDDNIEGPVIIKHWRQDWKYEDNGMLEYRGNNTWQNVVLSPQESQGKWTQAVFQVDDSPRYESIGEWTHDGNYSAWTSGTTWRPLPRREFSVRDDYGVLEGVNRHIITPNGWVHEQDNLKLIVDESGNPLTQNPYIAKEAGFNRYVRVVGDEYEPGFEYWTRTGEFWGDVRDVWHEVLSEDTVMLKSSHDGKKIYEYLFEYVGQVEESGVYDKAEGERFASETIKQFVVQKGGTTDTAVY